MSKGGFAFGLPASNVAASREPRTFEGTGFQLNEADTTTLTPASGFTLSQAPPIKCVLDNPDETSDVVLEVEGKQLHASRAVLAHYSPVFRKMFYSDFKEKSETKVPLPGKSHEEMALFFNVMYAQDTASSAVGKDEELVPLLTLADEYQVDQVKVKCQEYIGEQLAKFYQKPHANFKGAQKAAQQNQTGGRRRVAAVVDFGHFQPTGQSHGPQGANKVWVNRLTLFLRVCDEHQLPRCRDDVMSLLLEQLQSLDDVAKGQYYDSLPLQSKVDLLERLCRKLDGSADNLQPSATAVQR